jgi:hypothetical protein
VSFAAAVLAAARYVAAAQLSEVPPSAAVAAPAVAAGRREAVLLHVVAVEQTVWEQLVAATRVEAQQPLEQCGMASAFGLAARFAAPVTLALQHRVLAQQAAWLDQTCHRLARWSATVEHRKPVPSPERLHQVLASTWQAPTAYPWYQAPAGRWSSESACRFEPDPAPACGAAPLSRADARSRPERWQAEL